MEKTEKLEDKNKLGYAMQVSQEKIMQALDWAYNSTIHGLPKQKDIYSLVDDYLSRYDAEAAIKRLVNYQTTKAATSGFLTGLGGIITLPVAIPANIASVILFQMRMIAAIAVIRGYSLESDQVRTFVYVALTGSSVVEILKNTGIKLGNQFAKEAVKKIPGPVLTKINQKVGFRLLTKFGEKGTINIHKMIPVAGAAVGMFFDASTTRSIAAIAKKTFSDEGIDLGDGTFLLKTELEDSLEQTRESY